MGHAENCNVLLITFDQIRADCLNGPLAEAIPTPNLDRLQRESVVFENHFTVTVPCGPARASLLTGLYAMNHRSIRNGTPLARHHATIATEARKAGYEPLLFGYTDTTPDPSGMASADPDLLTYEGVAPGFRELVEMRFEECTAWRAYLATKGYNVPTWRDGPNNPFFRPVPEGENAPSLGDPTFYSAEDSETAFLTDKFLEAMAVRLDRAWFAHLTYIRPHPPLIAAAPYNRLVDPMNLPPPVPSENDHPFISAWFSEPSKMDLFWDYDGRGNLLSKDTIVRLRAIYCGLIAELDYHLGRVLAWLDETGAARQTVLILTSDHGEMLGDKGMWGKDTVYDPAFQIPLMIRDPQKQAGRGERISVLTESVDIAPTILERIGLSKPHAMDGQSLVPWITGEKPDWRDAILAEVDFAEPAAPTRFQRSWSLPADHCNAVILRETNWKLVHFNGGLPPMLFDLETDPDETNDLANDPAHRGEVLRLTQKLLDKRMTRNDRRLTGISIGC